MKKNSKENGITLIALVITIILLIILAGIAITSLRGNNGLLTYAEQSKKEHIEAQMEEELVLAVQSLQVDKIGGASLEDITQEWVDANIDNKYDIVIQSNKLSDGSVIVTMQKEGIMCDFLIDGKLKVIKILDVFKNVQYLNKSLEEYGFTASWNNTQSNSFDIGSIGAWRGNGTGGYSSIFRLENDDIKRMKPEEIYVQFAGYTWKGKRFMGTINSKCLLCRWFSRYGKIGCVVIGRDNNI